MRIIILSIKQHSRQGRICPSKEAYERIGNLSFTQLASIRHRGAFTTVALTFSTCCQLVKHLNQAKAGAECGTALLEQWYAVSPTMYLLSHYTFPKPYTLQEME